MKNILLVLVFSLPGICVVAQAQQVTLPDAVKASLSALYPNAQSTEWEVEDGMYEASFMDNNVKTSVVFSRDGRVSETETEIAAELLPQAIRNYFNANFTSGKIDVAQKKISPTGKISYEVEAGKKEYLFDASGHFLMMEEDDEDENED